jgi:hypothetical protein
VFLELVLAHPTWLQTFLMEAPYGHQNSARTWASDMLVWTMQAATKRCAHALQVGMGNRGCVGNLHAYTYVFIKLRHI